MIEGKAVVEFGTGDILITPIAKEDLSKGCVVLQNKGTHVIGEYMDATYFTGEETDTVISFTKKESIDALIERLEVLKSMMLGEGDDNAPIAEYDF